jgi:hypothetical protein
MKSFERYAFENQSPERQMELIYRHEQQQIQRRMLEEQIAERERLKQLAMEARERRTLTAGAATDPIQSSNPNAASGPVFVSDVLGELGKSLVGRQPQRRSMHSDWKNRLACFAGGETRIREAFSRVRSSIDSSTKGRMPTFGGTIVN